ncbi:hypothetical protein OG440_31495 [Streptomyces sp. NBC_00637]|uniref:hypothetical protein n=1 Tax=Streptomyces sp. NBC_00637 TaxID=2903667 RepID=UPI0032500E6C
MGTAERREAPEKSAAASGTALRDPEASDRDIPTNEHVTAERSDSRADRREATGRTTSTTDTGTGTGTGTAQVRAVYRPLWVEEPARRRRMPDPVRTAAVRAVLVIAVTLIQAMVAFLCTLAGSWLAFPMVISSVVSTVLATWGALDVWVTRQVWNQRNGVVSTPSSTARSLRRERRRARRQVLAAERAQERIRRQGGTGQLSHS